MAYFCLKDGLHLPKNLPKNFDKLGHITFHFGVVVSWFLYLKSRQTKVPTRKILLQSILISVFFGVLLEFFQSAFTDTRTADWHDVLANSIGASMASFVIYFVRKSILKSDGL